MMGVAFGTGNCITDCGEACVRTPIRQRMVWQWDTSSRSSVTYGRCCSNSL